MKPSLEAVPFLVLNLAPCSRFVTSLFAMLLPTVSSLLILLKRVLVPCCLKPMKTSPRQRKSACTEKNLLKLLPCTLMNLFLFCLLVTLPCWVAFSLMASSPLPMALSLMSRSNSS
eukprot:Lithocolla_globosa_v1_NODE_1043_length_2920_cov_340.169284.p3 type:complete len:116 gc:universal NODE_1043_length_2920_cov_340.169284:1578-1231(-)